MNLEDLKDLKGPSKYLRLNAGESAKFIPSGRVKSVQEVWDGKRTVPADSDEGRAALAAGGKNKTSVYVEVYNLDTNEMQAFKLGFKFAKKLSRTTSRVGNGFCIEACREGNGPETDYDFIPMGKADDATLQAMKETDGNPEFELTAPPTAQASAAASADIPF